MFLLDVLKCILCCGQDEQEQDLYSYRNNRDYSSLNPPPILRSKSSPQNHLYRDEFRPILPAAPSNVDSRGNSKLPDVTRSHGDGNRTISSPSFSSSVRDSSNSNISGGRFSIGPEKLQIKKSSAACSPETPYTASQQSKFPISSSTTTAPLSQKPSYAPVASTNSKLPDVTRSHADGNRTISSNFSSPSFSSSVRDSSNPAPSSSKPSFAPVSFTNSNISGGGLSIGPEKLQIKKNSAACSPETPYTASQLSSFPSSHISSSTATAPLSQKPSYATGFTTNNNGSVAGLSIDPEILQIIKGLATTSQQSKAPSPSISSYAAAAARSSKNPPLASISSTINKISPGVSTLLSKDDSLYTCSAKDSISPAPQSKASSSKNPSLATVSSTNSSVSEAPVRVWQVKLSITPDSTTKLAEKLSSSSPSLPSSRKDAISPAPQSIPPPVRILTANNSVSWQKKKQTSTELSRESVHNLPALSPSLIKVNVSFDSSSTSEASSPSSSLESRISNRRVLPKYEIPKYLEEMIRNDIVPPVLRCPLSPSTYRDFFATLLYAEDFYVEKWSEYLLEGIELKLRPRINSTNSKESSMKRKNTILVQRNFVAFEIDSVPERRPYLLSRDFVFLKPLNEIAGPFKGRLFRVVKSTTVLVEFGDDFHSQHSPSKRYDVSFSFNRVCLKRAHQAISVASDPSFRSILFPDQSFSSHPNTFPRLHENAIQYQDHVRRILNHKGPIPYLLNEQLVKKSPFDQSDQGTCLSSTGLIIQAAMLNIYRTNPRCRILVCSSTNNKSDVLLRSLTKKMPKSSLFRANAAYRDYDLVPADIIPASLYEEDDECFVCPPLAELLNFNIITCTFMSSYRLHAAGIDSEHFTHIFLVDASLATEPETIVPLANLAGKNTIIVLTGCSDKSPYWVRADIARRHGLKVSYFNRLLAMEPYRGNDSMFISRIA